jgi:hypothetical protein
MSNVSDRIPSSLRKPMETSRFAYKLDVRSSRPLTLDAGTLAASLSKSRFARLPQEPEDARLTGVTRSLQRRLLALNVTGSLVQIDSYLHTKIA